MTCYEAYEPRLMSSRTAAACSNSMTCWCCLMSHAIWQKRPTVSVTIVEVTHYFPLFSRELFWTITFAFPADQLRIEGHVQGDGKVLLIWASTQIIILTQGASYLAPELPNYVDACRPGCNIKVNALHLVLYLYEWTHNQKVVSHQQGAHPWSSVFAPLRLPFWLQDMFLQDLVISSVSHVFWSY